MAIDPLLLEDNPNCVAPDVSGKHSVYKSLNDSAIKQDALRLARVSPVAA
jgi:hypothetical protein